jgi:flagellin FlaB
MNSIKPNDEGFTGLEAAIVLIAFVVVAAVFSYVVLGAGFFTTQKSQETVHSAVGQASSTMELSGPVIAHCGGSGVDSVKFYLQLASGGTQVDLTKIVLTTSTTASQETVLWSGATKAYTQGPIVADGILAKGDMVFVTVPVGITVNANEHFNIDIQPDKGAALTVTRTAPAACSAGDHEVY